jgi:hypothetical protein
MQAIQSCKNRKCYTDLCRFCTDLFPTTQTALFWLNAGPKTMPTTIRLTITTSKLEIAQQKAATISSLGCIQFVVHHGLWSILFCRWPTRSGRMHVRTIGSLPAPSSCRYAAAWSKPSEAQVFSFWSRQLGLIVWSAWTKTTILRIQTCSVSTGQQHLVEHWCQTMLLVASKRTINDLQTTTSNEIPFPRLILLQAGRWA